MVKPPTDPRQQRLAAALRANLLRRKARVRGDGATAPEAGATPEPDASDPPGSDGT